MDGIDCLGLLSVATDISDVRQAQHFLSDINETVEREVSERTRELENLAAADPLTGLANRRIFLETLERSTRQAQSSGVPLSILYMDVDHFKRVNDSHGHAIGDEVLIGVARALKKHFRSTDLLSRLGGDEFAAILPSTTQRVAEKLSSRIRLSIHSLSFKRFPEPVSVSIGIATLAEGNTPEELLHRADMALLSAKRSRPDHRNASEPQRDSATSSS
jgi:diguanylate cyclase (GGDEF)-like protein